MNSPAGTSGSHSGGAPATESSSRQTAEAIGVGWVMGRIVRHQAGRLDLKYFRVELEMDAVSGYAEVMRKIKARAQNLLRMRYSCPQRIVFGRHDLPKLSV